LDRLETYKDAYEKLLAVPVIGGTKSENEKFAGTFHSKIQIQWGS
jgi:prolyl-tRNA synthetase